MLKLMKLDDGTELLITPQSQNIQLPGGTISRLLVLNPTPNTLYDFSSVSPMSYLQLLNHNQEQLRKAPEDKKLELAEKLGLNLVHPFSLLEQNLNLLPTRIFYKVPYFTSQAHAGQKELEPKPQQLYSDVLGNYELDIRRRVEDGKWEIQYVHYNIWEGYPEAFLPCKPYDDIKTSIEEFWGEGEENWGYISDPDLYTLPTSSDNLGESCDIVLKWLREEKLIS